MQETKEITISNDREKIENEEIQHYSTKPIVSFTMYLDPNHYSVIQEYDLLSVADFLHCMAYDNTDKKGHSTVAFAKKGLTLAQSHFENEKRKFTLGVPFYGRSMVNMEPAAYYDIAPSVSNFP